VSAGLPFFAVAANGPLLQSSLVPRTRARQTVSSLCRIELGVVRCPRRVPAGDGRAMPAPRGIVLNASEISRPRLACCLTRVLALLVRR
jgi:hypothetical protein